jgi:hypothetical protein
MISDKREKTGMPEDTGNIKVSFPDLHAKAAVLINSCFNKFIARAGHSRYTPAT